MKRRYPVAIATLGLAVGALSVPVSAAAAGTDFDQYIVTFADSANSHHVTHSGVTELRSVATGGVVVRAPRRFDKGGTQRLMAELAAQPGVVSVEPDLVMH